MKPAYTNECYKNYKITAEKFTKSGFPRKYRIRAQKTQNLVNLLLLRKVRFSKFWGCGGGVPKLVVKKVLQKKWFQEIFL